MTEFSPGSLTAISAIDQNIDEIHGSISACQPHTVNVAATNAARVCYTTDTSTPTCSAEKSCSNGLDSAVTPVSPMTRTTTVKAISCGDTNSAVATAVYSFPLAYVSSSIEDGSESAITVLLDQTITSGAADVVDFTVKVGGISGRPVAISQNLATLTLMLAAPVTQGQVVTVAYTKSLTTQSRQLASVKGMLQSFADQAVHNLVGVTRLLTSILSVASPLTNEATYDPKLT